MRRNRLKQNVIVAIGVGVILVAVVLVVGATNGNLQGSVVSVKGACGLDLGSACGPDNAVPPAKVAWTPPQIGVDANSKVCKNWMFYHRDKDGNVNIFRLGDIPGKPNANPDVSNGAGSGVRDISPSRAPDGMWVAFTSNRNGNWEIYIAAADGSRQQRVTYTTTAANLSPMWSPDGASLVYETTRHGSRDLYTVNIANGTETRLTNSPGNEVNPYWSPDSKSVVFQTDQDGLWQLYVLDIATGKQTRISDGTNDDINPQYSPDGTQIVFRSYAPSGDNNNAVIYTMNVDGSNRHAISDSKGNAANQAWSPDGTLIAYQSNLTGSNDIYVYQVSTGKTRQVIDGGTQNYAPTWRCDSSTLVFTSSASSTPQIYQVSALPIDAQALRIDDATKLTNDDASNQYPQNSPAVEDASHRGQEGSPQ